MSSHYGTDKGSRENYSKVANALGWFSIGLGLAEIAAPGLMSDLIGVRGTRKKRAMLPSPLYGMREVAAGVGILTQSKPAGWMWGRGAGDAMDIASLIAALADEDNDRKRVAGALVAVLGVTALDFVCAQNLSTSSEGAQSWASGGRAKTMKSVWVNKSAEEAYNFWRDFENAPRFMTHIESVERLEDGKTRWRTKEILGKSFEWESRVTHDEPNRLIAWRSVDGSALRNSGHVSFETGPGGRGAIVRLDLSFAAPMGGLLTKALSKAGGQFLTEDLRRFKRLLEMGELIQSDASVHTGMHPAQPSEETPGIGSENLVRA